MSTRNPPIATLIYADARVRFLRAVSEFLADKANSDAEKRDEIETTLRLVRQTVGDGN